MKSNRNLLVIAAAIICCGVIVWFSVSIQGSQQKYEIQPHITIPESKTDATRAIDAYERLMERYMDLTEKSLFKTGTDIQEVAKKLKSIDDKLTKLSTRIAGIEKALGIKQADPNDTKEPQTEPVDKKTS